MLVLVHCYKFRKWHLLPDSSKLIAIAVNCLYVNCDWWFPLDGGGVPGGVEDGELLGGDDDCRSGHGLIVYEASNK